MLQVWRAEYSDRFHTIRHELYSDQERDRLQWASTSVVDSATDRLLRLEEDNDGDGVVDSRTLVATVDREDGIVTTLEFDVGPDGVTDGRTVQAFNGRGQLLSVEDDADADGRPDVVERFEYDDNGKQVLYEMDHDGDGEVDERTVAIYDRGGNVLVETHEEDRMIAFRKVYDYSCW